MAQQSIAFDLVDEMNWEDVADELGLFMSLEDAGLETAECMPMFGGHSAIGNGIYSYTAWFYDGDESAFSVM